VAYMAVQQLAALLFLLCAGAHAYPSPTSYLNNSAVSTNVCDLVWYYCPLDPGCKNYQFSVQSVTVFANGYPLVKSEDLKPNDAIEILISGPTSMPQVPDDGNFLIYDGAGKNMAAGPLAGALTITAGSFHLTVKFTLDAASCGTDFEFGVDIFSHKSEGSPEAMCIQIASPARYKQESGKSGFALDCKDQGDGTWTPGSTPVVPHSVPAPKCTGPAPPPAPGCKLNWFYCPRDPGCVGYSMSAETVDVTVDDSSIQAGDMVVMNVTGTTTLKAVPLSSTYKVYDQEGKNMAQGNLADILTLDPATGSFKISVSIQLDAASVQGDLIEWGLDIFQGKSGSDEGMCIQIASDAYVQMVQPKASPPFVTYCEDEGHGIFKKKTIPEKVGPVVCQLQG